MGAYSEIEKALQPWLANRIGAESVQIRDLHRHSEGFSWHTYTLTALWRAPQGGKVHRKGLVIRREPEDGLLAPYDIRAQYEIHRAVLGNSRVPMAKLYWLELDPSILGMPFYVMERVNGVVPVQWQGNDPKIFPTPDVRRQIGLEFVDVLAKIHALDWTAAGLGFLVAPSSPEEAIDREITHWERFYEESFLLDLPVLRETIAWLRWNGRASGRVTLCHGDYRIGNFMLRGQRIVAVFDWELTHIGDPVEDIAYSGLPLFRGRSPLLSQLLEPSEYFARYEQRTGLRVDPKVFRFWTVLGFLKTGAPHLRAARAFEDGRVSDLRLAAMGHQVLFILKQVATELGLRKVGA